MANGVFIKVSGLDELRKKFKSIPAAIEAEIDAELSAVADNFVNRAVAAAPVDTGILRAGISKARLSSMNYEVVSSAFYSAYLEWGTITHVKVPPELQQYALQFKGKGIKKTGGIYPRPFFFIQIPKAEQEKVQFVETAINRALK